MGGHILNWSVNRRSLRYRGLMLVGRALLGPPLSPEEARAASVTSWDCPQNENLGTAAITERFERIHEAYDVGQAFSAEDADFILRYAKPFLSGEHGQASSRSGDGARRCEVNISTSDSYVGDFVYRCSAIVQAGCPDGVCRDVRIEERRTVYGLTHPFAGGSIGIVDCFEQAYSQETEDWFTAEFVDEFTGVAIGFYAYYRAFITLANGDVLELGLEL